MPNFNVFEKRREHLQSRATNIFVEGFEAYSDYAVRKWWKAVKDCPAPRCTISVMRETI